MGGKATVKKIFSTYGIIVAFVVIVVVMSILSKHFLKADNLMNLIRQVSFNGMIAIGMTFVIMTGGIDLSVGSVVALAGVITASFQTTDKPEQLMMLIPAILMGLLVSAICGLANGMLITKGKLAPFIVTMGMMTIVRGIAMVYVNGRPIVNFTDAFKVVGGGYVGPIPIPVIIFAVVIVISILLLNFLTFGRHVKSVGGNEAAAKAAGLNVDGIKIKVYVLNSVLAGLAGIALASRVNAAQSIFGEGYELDAIAAAVIGGTSMSGGVGTIWGTVIGTLIIGIISNGLDLLNVSAYYQMIAKGLIILVAVLLDRKNK